MSKIVFFCIPAHGHTNPTLRVVQELVSRGHQVWYYSYNSMKDKIESAGAEFVSCDNYDMEQKLSPQDGARIGKDLAFSTKILVDTTLALDDKICADMAHLKPDCIVADSMAIWGKAVAMKLGIPFVSSTTTFAFNRHSAKIMKHNTADMVKIIFSLPKISKDIKRLQDKGYPVKSVLDLISNDENTDTIVYTSPQFQPCSDTFSDKYVFVGPSIRPATEKIEKTRDKLVYISMGTVNNDMMPLYKSCIEAFRDSGFQVILSVGNMVSAQVFDTLPENISVFPYVDQIAVLNKADVFISHCGMNSASESLYFGVPLVMLPQTYEQRGVAERILQLGAGVKPDRADSGTICDAVKTVLADSQYKENANKIAEDFRKCTGAKGAADKILSMI
ncbi:MAG: glucosyltransferase [Oscillospiraceae bacterium]|nr:glucosyltransferase [Oscillospiraceae bacterium]